MAGVDLVITLIPHDEGETVDGGKIPPREFGSVAEAKAAADEYPVPDEWRVRESIRDRATGTELWRRTDRIPGWMPCTG